MHLSGTDGRPGRARAPHLLQPLVPGHPHAQSAAVLLCLPVPLCPCREQLADSVLTLLFAGHDTSATTLTRLFSHLHRHPAAAERLRLEQVRQRHPRTAAAAAGRRVCRPAAVLFDT